MLFNPLSPRIAKILAQGLQRYDSPSDWVRKLFKPSMDSASLRVEIEKNFFVLGLRFSEGGRHKWGYHFCFFWPALGLLYAALDAIPMT